MKTKCVISKLIGGVLGLVVMGMVGSANATLLGQTFDGGLGINQFGGPFDSGFSEQLDGGLAIAGTGVEYTDLFGVNVDIGANEVLFAGFNSGHNTSLPFNGWVFVMPSPTVAITDVSLLSTTVSGLTQSNIEFNSTGFAVNAVGSMVGNLRLSISTSSLSQVPEPTSLALFVIALGGLGFMMRRRFV